MATILACSAPSAVTLMETGAYLLKKPAPQTPQIQDELDELDVDASLAVARAVLSLVGYTDDEEWVVTPTSAKDVKKTDVKRADVVRVCASNLAVSVNAVQADVAALERTHAEHRAKWFASWRTLDTAALSHRMRLHKHQMDTRLTMLLTVMKLSPWSPAQTSETAPTLDQTSARPA